MAAIAVILFLHGAPAASNQPASPPMATPDQAQIQDDAGDNVDSPDGLAVNAPSEASEVSGTALRAEESAAPASTDWGQRVANLADQIDKEASSPKDADRLYRELETELWAYQDEVYASLRARSHDALDLRENLIAMYNARIHLLELVTPQLRNKLMGANPAGLLEIRREFANAKLEFLYQALTIPRGLRQLAANVRESPLDSVWRVIELFIGIFVFRAWRRWAKDGLTRIRMQILSIRPRSDIHVHVARLIWYLQRFRAPLEWLALLFYVSAIVEPGDFEEVGSLVWIILLWTLLTRFGLLLVDALASRRTASDNSSIPGLRLRSLRLVAAWVLLTGLGLDLTSRYVGEATIHTWAKGTFALLLVPIALYLLHAWRGPIVRRLESDATFSPTARRMGKRDKGLGSYLNAAAGAIYILGAELLKRFIRFASRFESGRKIVATLLRREVEKDAQRNGSAEKRISDDLILELLTPDDTIIDGPFREGIERIQEIVESGRGATVAVMAERGGGLATFLRVLKEDIGESMRIVDSPPGGPKQFTDALRKEFGLGDEADLSTLLRPRLDAEGVRSIAISNYHRVARPKRGGVEGIIRASEIAEAVGEDILWIVGLTSASWPYINRMLGDRAILQEIIELPPWSESQLEELFDARCRKADIEPDYRRLDFPRQFDDGENETLEKRNRVGFRRVLWELSDGNPEVAIRLFTDSLRELPSGKLIVRLPQPASLNKVNAANRTTMLILKVLVETEMSTIEDLALSIRASATQVNSAIDYCVQLGWVEEVYDHYQITWASYRTIKRVLVRRGLIPR